MFSTMGEECSETLLAPWRTRSVNWRVLATATSRALAGALKSSANREAASSPPVRTSSIVCAIILIPRSSAGRSLLSGGWFGGGHWCTRVVRQRRKKRLARVRSSDLAFENFIKRHELAIKEASFILILGDGCAA